MGRKKKVCINIDVHYFPLVRGAKDKSLIMAEYSHMFEVCSFSLSKTLTSSSFIPELRSPTRSLYLPPVSGSRGQVIPELRSPTRSLSRHGNDQASFSLLIWLIENVGEVDVTAK